MDGCLIECLSLDGLIKFHIFFLMQKSYDLTSDGVSLQIVVLAATLHSSLE